MSVNTSRNGQFRSAASTNVGAVRNHNEDQFVDRPDLGLWAVADGAGGHDAGDVASARIAELLGSIPTHLNAPQILSEVRSRLAQAHADLREEAARRGPRAMVASTVVVLLARDTHFACLWAGDSRAYLMRNGKLTQVTRDHSLLQELLDSGAITEQEAVGHPQGNVITRAVGADAETLDLDKVTGQILPGDRFLLCSDGLCKTLDESELAAILRGNGEIPVPERLVQAALDHHVGDNVTAVEIEVVAHEAPQEVA
jgi:serine/threonine-protein phosphatase Stp1